MGNADDRSIGTADSNREREWKNLIPTLTGRAHAYLRQIPCSIDEREAILWDAWAVAAETEDDFIQSEDPWNSLLPILQAVCRDRMRVWRHEVSNTVTPGPPLMDESPGDEARWDDRDAIAAALLAKLPAKERVAVDLRLCHGIPYAVIAAATGQSEAAVRKAFSRGIIRLKRLAGAVRL